MKKLGIKGFSAVEAVVIIVVIGLVAGAGFYVMNKPKDEKKVTGNTQGTPTSDQTATTSSDSSSQQLVWQQRENGWAATSTAPACPDQPILKMPSDISKVTSVLYPGQTRGGNYKPHGGFRFDNATTSDIKVTAPLDGFVVRGSRYFAEGTTEVQYTIDVMNNCGVLYRLGHLLKLDAKYQALADKFPAAGVSSQTTNIMPAVAVKSGETMATQVGITTGGLNVFYDFGVYDQRAKNAKSADSAWASSPSHDAELAQHAVCWLKSWLPSADQTKLLALPAGDPASGKTSDYC